MDEQHFIEILRKYLNGNATNEEEHFLFTYYNLFADEPDTLALLNEEEKQKLKDQIDEDILNNIEKHEALNRQKVRRMYFIKVGAAAALVVAILTAGLILLQKPAKDEARVAADIREEINHLVHLPDGSIVIVTAGSKLTAPESFDKLSKREVYLEGQAYFDIKHNPEKPFIVHTGKIQTRVLGTAFNIDAWPVSSDIRVTVTRGLVKINDSDKTLGTIKLNQQLTYDKLKGNASQKTVNSSNYVAWEKQDLFCNNVSVEETCNLLKEKFNITVNYTDEAVKNKRFTTTLLKNEPIERVLKSICEFTNSKFTYDKATAAVVISGNQQ